jgi:predicted esterase
MGDVMGEHHLPVSRTARYFTLGEIGPATREVWIVLHGYGQLAARFLRQFEPLAGGGRVIVAPEGLSRFYLETSLRGSHGDTVGATWMTREDRLADIADYVHYLDALQAAIFSRVERGAASLHVLGFSQGTATASRWTALGSGGAPPDRLTLWGGEVPPDLDLAVAAERWRGLRLALVVADGDEYITPKVLARDEARLRAHAIPYEVRRFAGGHTIDPAVLGELAR